MTSYRPLGRISQECNFEKIGDHIGGCRDRVPRGIPVEPALENFLLPPAVTPSFRRAGEVHHTKIRSRARNLPIGRPAKISILDSRCLRYKLVSAASVFRSSNIELLVPTKSGNRRGVQGGGEEEL